MGALQWSGTLGTSGLDTSRETAAMGVFQTSVSSRPYPSWGLVAVEVFQESGTSGLDTSRIGCEQYPIGEVADLYTMFEPRLSRDQISVVYSLSGENFPSAMDTLVSGPTLGGIVAMCQERIHSNFPKKVQVDSECIWVDTVAHYKSWSLDVTHPIRVIFDGQPAIDTGGVRRQLFTDVYKEFVDNAHVRLFAGPRNALRPIYSVEARSSGLFKVLGKMIGHSIQQEGIGFPYLSDVCYQYIVAREEAVVPHITLADVGADVSTFITQVLLLKN